METTPLISGRGRLTTLTPPSDPLQRTAEERQPSLPNSGYSSVPSSGSSREGDDERREKSGSDTQQPLPFYSDRRRSVTQTPSDTLPWKLCLGGAVVGLLLLFTILVLGRSSWFNSHSLLVAFGAPSSASLPWPAASSTTSASPDSAATASRAQAAVASTVMIQGTSSLLSLEAKALPLRAHPKLFLQKDASHES